MSAPVALRHAAAADSETVRQIQGRRRSGAAGPHRNSSDRDGTRRGRIAAALAEYGLTIDDVLNGLVD